MLVADPLPQLRGYCAVTEPQGLDASVTFIGRTQPSRWEGAAMVDSSSGFTGGC